MKSRNFELVPMQLLPLNYEIRQHALPPPLRGRAWGREGREGRGRGLNLNHEKLRYNLTVGTLYDITLDDKRLFATTFYLRCL